MTEGLNEELQYSYSDRRGNTLWSELEWECQRKVGASGLTGKRGNLTLDLVLPVICYEDYFSFTSFKNGRLKKSVSQGVVRI